MNIYANLSILLTALSIGHDSLAACPSPNLAPAYSDCNGDMVADAPDDKTQWLDPDPIVLADVPTSDMTERAAQAEPFLRYMEKAVGRKFTYFVAKDYTDLLAAFKANRIHLININSGSVESEVRCHGYVPLAQAVDTKGNIAGAQMELIVPANSPLKTARDLKGHKLTFVNEQSNNGYKTPRALLAKEFGLEAGRDYSFNFSGRHDNSVMGVANGLYEAAASGSDVREKLLRDGMIDAATVRVVYTSRTFPQSPWGISYRLNPKLADRIGSAFLSYKSPADASYISKKFKAANYKTDWAIMREISAASGTPLDCK